MHSSHTNRAPADDAQANAASEAVPGPAADPKASDATADARHSIEYWYFCGEGAAMRLA